VEKPRGIFLCSGLGKKVAEGDIWLIYLLLILILLIMLQTALTGCGLFCIIIIIELPDIVFNIRDQLSHVLSFFYFWEK
jgi:hypothetical protein